ncbi:glucan endo-1,3-beta-D-glucosidase-like [Salvia hispanica]|uniref:glucan endo-1,3-beta-D-glucosidase-like n=1 Tax=Salvia hispanica TaxID=49212 RepID=UPI002009D339|nr:glucan endo-1,3-beta-D-glucosidase-like [Salvia hispanica]
MKLSLIIAMVQLGLLISCVAAEQWCVVAPGARDEQMQAFLNTACNQLVDCKDIKPGGSCYEPDTLQNHASYILNLVYRSKGQCDKAVGIISVNDPSFGKCQYS